MEDNEVNKKENTEENNEKSKRKTVKELVKNWLKDKHNLFFIGIVILTILIGGYYFSLTKNQPLWWDESDYLAYAKNLAGYNVDWIVTKDHNSLFSYIVALFFILKFSEPLTKFFVEFIPYVLVIVLIYLVAGLMYKDKRIALISSILFFSMDCFIYSYEVPGRNPRIVIWDVVNICFLERL